MSGQSYLISGGSGDIGQAICEKLTAQGHTPIIGYAKNKPTSGDTLHLDLTDADSIAKAVATIQESTPDLAGVVLAGSPAPTLGLFGRITDTDMAQQLQVNVIGTQTLLAGLVRNVFRKNKYGSVIGILTKAMGSETGPAMSNMGAYVIAKHGLYGVLKLLAADYNWLHVDTVSPGFTETKMLNAFDERFLEQMRAQVTFQTPADIADEVIAKLQSPAEGTQKYG